MSTTRPRVSIVMPCYNGAGHLARSVGSVLAQTCPDWELVLVDDGSTDGSAPLIDQLALQHGRIRPVHQPNGGVVAARNAGIALCRGDFIGFLDADDRWHTEFLSTMLAALDGQPDAGIAYCGWQNVGLGPGRDDPYLPPDYEAVGKLAALLKSCPWPIHGALVRRTLFERHGGFDSGFNTSEDFDLWLRMGLSTRLLLVPKVMAYYQHHAGERLTSDPVRMALDHLKAQQKFLRAHGALVAPLGQRRIRELTIGSLLHRGYVAYWRRDLQAARTIFREVTRHGYGGPKDWFYMLPAWLPESWHRLLLARRDASPAP